jgi:hypothetical protein
MIRVARRGSKGNPCAGRPWGAPWPPSPQRAQRPQRAQIRTLHQGLGGHWVRLEFLRPMAPFRITAPGPGFRGHWLRFATPPLDRGRRCAPPGPHPVPLARSCPSPRGRGALQRPRAPTFRGHWLRFAMPFRRGPLPAAIGSVSQFRGNGAATSPPRLTARPLPVPGAGSWPLPALRVPNGFLSKLRTGLAQAPGARAGGTPAPPMAPPPARATCPVHGAGNGRPRRESIRMYTI